MKYNIITQIDGVKQYVRRVRRGAKVSVHRASLSFETDLVHEKTMQVSVFELTKTIKQIENIITEICNNSLGIKTEEKTKDINNQL